MLNIGIDVDLTLLDPICCQGGWQDWLEERSIYYYPKGSLTDYYIAGYYPDVEDPLAFWSQENLYSQLQPYKQAKEVIERLSDKHNIFFISYCKKGHFGGKVDWIKKTFNIPKDRFHFAATKQKHMCAVDVMIDDRADYLIKFGGSVLKMLYKTNYSQDVETIGMTLVDDWDSIGKILENDRA